MASLQSRLVEYFVGRSTRSWGESDLMELRRKINRVPDVMMRPCRGVRVVPVDTDAVSAEWLVPAGADDGCVLMYIHGGAWFSGSAKASRSFVSRLARASATRGFAIDYRLAPEHPFPAALDDCIAAYRWLRQSGISPDSIVVAGESSGGNLTLALMIALRDAGEPLPAGCIGISAITDLPGGAARDEFFRRSVEAYVGDHDPTDPLISPAYANLVGLPPMLLQVGGDEMLAEYVVPFGERAAAAGVQTETVAWPGMFHVFQMTAPFVPEARKANKEIVRFIKSRFP